MKRRGYGVTDLHTLNDRYELRTEIGRGGMATTYRARDRMLNRQVAVKVMHLHLSQSPEFAAAFRREAQAAASLSHPHIASVYDTGRDGDHHYLVMELVDGETLKARVRRAGGPLPVAEAVTISRQIAAALQAAHAQGLIHCDIKPHNILLTREGTVKVADFGIAQAASRAADSDTRVMGSAHYLAPEQIRGEPGAPPTDIYALGVVLYEMLTGAVPFTGPTPVAVAHRHLYDTPPVPRDLNSAIPAALQEVVLKALQKRSEQRYPDAARFVAALDAAAREMHPPAAVPSQTVRTRGRRRVGALLAVVMLVIVASGAIVVFNAVRPEANAAIRLAPLIGTDLTSARALLRSHGLELVVAGEEYNERLVSGLIARQMPERGTPIAPGSTVQVWTSKGPEDTDIPVPALATAPLEHARDELERLGLIPDRIVQEHHETIPSGFVTRTVPSAGRALSPGSRVVLYVSKGPKPPVEPAGVAPPLSGTSQSETVEYAVPSNSGERVEVVIRVRHPDGTVEILHRGVHFAGELITVTATYRRSATMQIFVAGYLTHEAVLGVAPVGRE